MKWPSPRWSWFLWLHYYCHSEATCHYSGLDLHPSFRELLRQADNEAQGGEWEKEYQWRNSSSLLESSFWYLDKSVKESKWLKVCWTNSATCLTFESRLSCSSWIYRIPSTRNYNTMTGGHPWCWVKLQFVSWEMRIVLELNSYL